MVNESDWLDRAAGRIKKRLYVDFDDARQTLALFRARGNGRQFAFLNAWAVMRREAEHQRRTILYGDFSDATDADDEQRNLKETLESLTARERYICYCWLNGWTLKQIGKKLGISPQRVNVLRRRALARVAL